MSNPTIPQRSPGEMLEKVLIHGDLKELRPEEKVVYYNHVCESLGLNPVTKPFQECFGSIYGYLQFISLGIRGLFKRVNIKIQNFIPWGWVCSEVVAAVLTKLPIEYFNKRDAKIFDAQDLYEKIIATDWKLIHVKKQNSC